jgi:phenylpropionate dioxygenase-like ring-hydroxylating dioxygenase large terminal subunit
MLSREEIDTITSPLERAFTLPPRCYTDPAFFEKEREEIFSREWICVARGEQVPAAGDYLSVDLVGQPVIVVRLKSGELHAMSGVCLHRAMPVAEGSGKASSFSCPYHLWKYDLEGQLISAPLMDGVEDFEPKDCRLAPVRLEEWQGFVFINLDVNAESLTARLRGLDRIIENYEIDRLRIAATTEFDSPFNWKLLIENFMEAYHHIGPHSQTFQPIYPAKDSWVEADPDHLWSVLHMPGLGEHDEEGFPTLPRLAADQANDLLAIVVSPTLIFAPGRGLVAWYQLEPESFDHMNLKIHMLLRPETIEDEEFATMIPGTMELVRMIYIEDIAVNEGPWKGLNAPLARAGRLSLLEKAIWHLNQFWITRIIAGRKKGG